jgi:aminopeptidase 2
MCRSNMMGDGPSVPLDREVLPTNVKPTSYHLTLEPNLETFEYDGEVAIK